MKIRSDFVTNSSSSSFSLLVKIQDKADNEYSFSVSPYNCDTGGACCFDGKLEDLRFEEPEDILNDMLAGLDEVQLQKVITIVDRRQAIKTACMMAQKGDVILIAGKGHEDYQIIKGVKHHFDDKEEVRACFTI